MKKISKKTKVITLVTVVCFGLIVGGFSLFVYSQKIDEQDITHFDNTEVMAYSSDGDVINSQIYYTYSANKMTEKRLKNEVSETEITDLEQYVVLTLNHSSRKVLANYSMNEIAITKIDEIEKKIFNQVSSTLDKKDITIQEINLGIPVRDERKSLVKEERSNGY